MFLAAMVPAGTRLPIVLALSHLDLLPEADKFQAGAQAESVKRRLLDTFQASTAVKIYSQVLLLDYSCSDIRAQAESMLHLQADALCARIRVPKSYLKAASAIDRRSAALSLQQTPPLLSLADALKTIRSAGGRLSKEEAHQLRALDYLEGMVLSAYPYTASTDRANVFGHHFGFSLVILYRA